MWSITVLYSPAAKGPFTGAGAPGPTNYVYTPKPLPSAASIPLTFTPYRAGYWEVSVSCEVAVSDSRNPSLGWIGFGSAGPTGSAGPPNLTSYTLDITYTGPVAGGPADSGTVVTNQSPPIPVHAGWPIQLGAKLVPADLSKTFTWSINGAGGNGAAAIGGYNPTSGPTSVSALDPGSSTGVTFPGANEYYYYTTAGSEKASVTPAGSGIPPATTTFSVTKPTAKVLTVTPGVYVWPTSGGFGFGQWMFNPPFGLLPGISFFATTGQNTGFSSSFNWLQVYAPDQSYWSANGSLLDTVGGAGLDTLNRNGGVFYGVSPPSDSPNTDPGAVANGPVGKIEVADHATMWLIYKPSVSGAIWIPIDSVSWNWGGTDLFNSGAGTWGIANSSSAQNPSGAATNIYPEWGSPANYQFEPTP